MALFFALRVGRLSQRWTYPGYALALVSIRLNETRILKVHLPNRRTQVDRPHGVASIRGLRACSVLAGVHDFVVS